LGFAALSLSQTQGRDIQSGTWAATDGLGRKLPDYAQAGNPKSDKFVGIFYFLWMQPSPGQQLYDNTKLVEANPTHPAYGPVGAFHWWGQPWLGYYLSSDDFVIRKHADELADAGVDVVIFDVTNGFTYDDTFLKLCKVYTQIRKEGNRTPQIAFFSHAAPAQVVQHLFDTFYAKGLYSDLWFRWKGKPLIFAPLSGLPPEVNNFFTIRESWAWTDPNGWFGNGKDKWPWLDNSPQKPSWHDDPNKPEEISISVAQHATTNIGRSFHAGKEPPPNQVHPGNGIYFAEQWDHARKVNPEFVWVTGWNEWIAQRFNNERGTSFLGRALAPGEPFFVDEYNEEYSRDIEPMRGGHGDNFYYQLAANVRLFKGVPKPSVPSAFRKINIRKGAGQWDSVRPIYYDHIRDTAHRDQPGWAGLHYVNDTGRNDFVEARVARDARNLYFTVRTSQPITKPGGSLWMALLLDIDRRRETGWEGYDYIINRETGWLEKNKGGWKWEKVCRVDFTVTGDTLQLAVPRAKLGLRGRLNFEFKWVDNVPESGNLLDFIDKGDVAPDGRFNYIFSE
jgi:hypothetical protein